MVIVAAIIGGFEDIGWEVLSSMRKAEFGQSILSGLVIALLAILIDRMTIGFAKASTAGGTRAMRWMTSSRLLASLLLALALAGAIRSVAPNAALLPNIGLPLEVGAEPVAARARARLCLVSIDGLQRRAAIACCCR